MNALPPLTMVDIAALILIAVGGIQGFFRGFSGEIARLLGVIIAFIGGTLLHEPIGQWVSSMTNLDARPAQALAFIATVIIAVVMMILVRILLKKVITSVFAEGFDKTAGVVAGLLRMSLFVCLFFIAMNMVPVESLNSLFSEKSTVGKFIIRYVPTVEKTLEKAGIFPLKGDNELDENNEQYAPRSPVQHSL